MTVNARRRRSLIAALRKTCPEVFRSPPVPLALDIERQIAEVVGQEWSSPEIATAVRWWTRRPEYLAAQALGGDRRNLDGTVTESQGRLGPCTPATDRDREPPPVNTQKNPLHWASRLEQWLKQHSWRPWVSLIVLFFVINLLLSFLAGAILGPVKCRDGWASHSIGRRGACSHHGGVYHSRGWIFILSLGVTWAVVAGVAKAIDSQANPPPKE